MRWPGEPFVFPRAFNSQAQLTLDVGFKDVPGSVSIGRLPNTKHRDALFPKIKRAKQRGGKRPFTPCSGGQNPVGAFIHSLTLLGFFSCNCYTRRHSCLLNCFCNCAKDKSINRHPRLNRFHQKWARNVDQLHRRNHKYEHEVRFQRLWSEMEKWTPLGSRTRRSPAGPRAPRCRYCHAPQST